MSKPVVTIKGRLSGPQAVLAVLVITGLIWGCMSGIAALVKVAYAKLCVSGLGGYSLGNEILIAVAVFIGLVFVFFGVRMFLRGIRICRQRRTVPLGYQPWFRTRLLEGHEAVQYGVFRVLGSVLLLSVAVAQFMPWISDSDPFLASPDKMARCNSLHIDHAGLPLIH